MSARCVCEVGAGGEEMLLRSSVIRRTLSLMHGIEGLRINTWEMLKERADLQWWCTVLQTGKQWWQIPGHRYYSPLGTHGSHQQLIQATWSQPQLPIRTNFSLILMRILIILVSMVHNWSQPRCTRKSESVPTSASGHLGLILWGTPGCQHLDLFFARFWVERPGSRQELQGDKQALF